MIACTCKSNISLQCSLDNQVPLVKEQYPYGLQQERGVRVCGDAVILNFNSRYCGFKTLRGYLGPLEFFFFTQFFLHSFFYCDLHYLLHKDTTYNTNTIIHLPTQFTTITTITKFTTTRTFRVASIRLFCKCALSVLYHNAPGFIISAYKSC